MNIELNSQAEATAQGLVRQAAVSHRHRDHQLDPAAAAELALRAEIDDLSRVAPAAAVAKGIHVVDASLRVASVEPDAQTASAPPFGTLEEIREHFWRHPADGVGLLTGPVGDDVLLAVRSRAGGPMAPVGVDDVLRPVRRVTVSGWDEWFRTAALVRTEAVDPDSGRPVVAERYLEPPVPTLARWHPAEPVRTRSVVALGRIALEEAGKSLGGHSAPAGPGLPAWAELRLFRVQSPPGQRLTFRAKKLGAGCELVGPNEVVPIWCRRGPWQLDYTTLPAGQPPVQWFLDALGVTSKAVAR